MAETENKQEVAGNGHESHAPPPELAKKVIEQVEYYFGDINLPRDKFLQDEIKKEDGWVPITTMLKFNRLKQLCDDIEQLANVLHDSLLIHVSQDNTKIRRNPEIPLPENSLEYWQEVKNRTVYVKGFPADTALDEIQEFVKPHGPVKNILMRRLKGEKTFKGSVFVTFADKESAQKFVQNDEVKEFKGQELYKLMQMDYWTKKNQENKQKREEAKALKQAKNKETQDESKKSVYAPIFVKGIILQVQGVPKEKLDSENSKETIKALKDFFQPYGEVAFIALVEGQDKVDIRFKTTEENYAAKVWEAAVKAASDGNVKFENAELQARVLEGEEEQRYWADFTKGKLAKIERISQGGRGRGRGRGEGRGRGGGRGRGRDRGGKANTNQRKHTVFKDSDDEESEGPPVKKTKDESNGGPKEAEELVE